MAEKNLRETPYQEQRIALLDRASMEITGLEDVVSFDEGGAVIKTTLGTLAIDGEGLHVTKLDLSGGLIALDGKINGLFYSDGTQKGKKRLFR